jgi:hypothetical protein
VAIATAGTGYKAGYTITIAADWDGAGKGDAVTLTVGAASTVTDKLTMTSAIFISRFCWCTGSILIVGFKWGSNLRSF